MKHYVLLLCFFGLAGVNSYGADDEIPMLGVDAEENEIRKFVPPEKFQEGMTELLSSVQGSTLKTIEQVESNQSSENSRWMLRDITIGIGLNLSAGLGPIYHVSAAPRVRACFSNSTHPRFQD